MGTKTYVFWYINITAFALGTIAGYFVTRVGNAFCAGVTMTFVALNLAIVGAGGVRILDKIDSERNKNEENGEDKN